MPWMSNKASASDKDNPNVGQVCGLGHVHPASDTGAGSAQGAALDSLREVGGGEAPEGVQAPGGPSSDPERRKSNAWRSLKEDHLKLAETNWTAPPQEEKPVKFPCKMTGRRKLTDVEVGLARACVAELGVASLARKFGVDYRTMWCAVKGYTYKHLNGVYPPQA